MKAEVGAACSDAACSRFIGVYRRNNRWPDVPAPATANVIRRARREAENRGRAEICDYAGLPPLLYGGDQKAVDVALVLAATEQFGLTVNIRTANISTAQN